MAKKKSKGGGKGLNLGDIDFKDFFLRYGERVGLWTAVAITGVMLVVGVFMNGLRADSADETATRIRGYGKSASQQLQNANPRAGAEDSPPRVAEASDIELIDPTALALAHPFYDASSPDDLKWRKPQLLAPTEFDASVVRVQVPSWYFSSDMEQIYIRKPKDASVKVDTKLTENLKTKLGSNRPGTSQSVRQQYLDYLMKRRAAAAGLTAATPGTSGQPPSGVLPHMTDPNQLKVVLDRDTSPQFELVPWEVSKLREISGEPAKYVRPYVMAIVSGSFPYKQQMESFRKALHYSSVGEMLHDKVKDPTIEFLGLNVQRRTLSLDGKEQSGWQPIDIETPYKQMRFLAVATEPEDPEWVRYGLIVTQIPAHKLINRLPKPATVGGTPMTTSSHGTPVAAASDVYPKPRLPSLDAALAELKKEAPKAVAAAPVKEARFDKDQYDPDKDDALGMATSGLASYRPIETVLPTPGAAPQPPAPPVDLDQESPSVFGGGRGGRGREGGDAGGPPPTLSQQVLLPGCCLLRFLDLTIKSGHLYEYRVQIRMTNPNYRRPELAISQNLINEAELTGPWTDVATIVDGQSVPLRVRVPDDTQFYAVDDPPDPTYQVVTMNDRLRANAQRTPVQIHRWVKQALINPNDSRSDIDLGEWTVVQRTLAYRGDFIGSVRDTLIPWFDPKANDFILVDQKGTRSAPGSLGKRGIPIDFNTHCILVDFEGGAGQTYAGEGQTISYDTPVQMLVMDPHGHLLAHNEKDDTLNDERVKRVETWKTRLQLVMTKGDKKAGSKRDTKGGRGGEGGGGGGGP